MITYFHKQTLNGNLGSLSHVCGQHGGSVGSKMLAYQLGWQIMQQYVYIYLIYASIHVKIHVKKWNVKNKDLSLVFANEIAVVKY